MKGRTVLGPMRSKCKGPEGERFLLPRPEGHTSKGSPLPARLLATPQAEGCFKAQVLLLQVTRTVSRPRGRKT